MNISIVLPALNEEQNIPDILRDIQAHAQRHDWNYEIIVVDDGSSDRTSAVAQQLSDTIPVTVVRHPTNRGYGAALRSGFHAATKEWVLFTDSDRQFDIADMDTLIAHSSQAEFVIGYRANRQDHAGRKLNAWLFNRAVRLLFGLRVHDIDCAFKLMRRDALMTLNLESSGALINTELLVKARQHTYRISEVPVTHLPRIHGAPTGARISVIVRALRELLLFRITGHVQLRKI